MRKIAELTNPMSCLNRAKPDEMVFVLLGRDIAAPVAIRAWANWRIQSGQNTENDIQITEALRCAEMMDRERREDEERKNASIQAKS